MKILVILTFYYPHWTGLTVHATEVAEGLAARGHEVTVLTTRHLIELPRDEVRNGVRIVRLLPIAQFSRGKIAPAFPWAAARLIAQNDVVQIHTPLPEASLVGVLCKSLGKPLLMTHHGDVVMPGGAFNTFIERSASVILRSAGMLADAVTSYSRDYAEHSQLLRHFRQKLHYIYPPVDIPEPDQAAALAWRHELGLDDRLLIGFAGRWVEEKGFDDLLRALPLIREAFPQAHLVYAGERRVVYDNFYELCKPLIEAQHEHLTFLGLINDKQRMADFYAMCDLFALPSRSDMMALVQVEAMLCGTSVVASDIPGARVVVQETGFGKLSEPSNPQNLAETIIEALRNRESYHPTRAAVREVFDSQRSFDQYEQLLQQLIVKHGQPADTADSAVLDQAQRQARATLQAIGASAPLLANPVPITPTSASRKNLTPDDRAVLEGLLRNEADMAFRRRAMSLMDYLDLQDGDTVLDCGCGYGVYLMMMKRLRPGIRLFGVDGDTGRLALAEKDADSQQLTTVDIHDLPYADNTFDKILLTEVLEHLADDRGALREIFRVLKPGGTLALSVPHANYPFLWDPINKTIEAVGLHPLRSAGPITGLWSNHWRLYRPAELRDVVGSAGFEVEMIEEQTHYAFPFIHFIVYSIGKPLIEKNLLPQNLRDSADRFRGERNSGSLLNPINLGVKLFRMADARNDALRGDEQTFVNLLAKARKPLQ